MQHKVSRPHHVPEQIVHYQGDQLIVQPVCRFDPAEAVGALQRCQRVLAIDIGGDKIRSAHYEIGNGLPTKTDEQVFWSRGGTGYLKILEGLADEAARDSLRVGISSATKMAGSTITRTVNLPVFFGEFRQTYGADYEKLFPGRSFAANDTVMGICGASTRLALGGTPPRDVAFVICASGMGASVVSNGVAIHVEVGHVPLVPSLNPLGQTTPCGVEGRAYVCVERVTAARAGIEGLYQKMTGESLDGVALGGKYAQGDPLATLLYETSACALAHAIVGVMERFTFADSERSVIVLHGGNFEIPAYREAVQRALDRIPHPRCRVVFSRDLSGNICLDGAAIMAAWSQHLDT